MKSASVEKAVDMKKNVWVIHSLHINTLQNQKLVTCAFPSLFAQGDGGGDVRLLFLSFPSLSRERVDPARE